MKRLFATTSYAAIVAYANTVVIRSLIDGTQVTIDHTGYDPSIHELHPDGGLLGVPSVPSDGPIADAVRISALAGQQRTLTDAEVEALKLKSTEPAHTTTPADEADEIAPLDNAECIAAYKGKVIAVVKENGTFKVIDNTDATSPKLVVWPDVVDPGGYKTNKAAWEVAGKIALRLA